MKLVSFLADNRPHFGIAGDKGVLDVSSRFASNYTDIIDFIEKGALPEVRRAMDDGVYDVPWSAVEYLPVLPKPGKIICIGLNYLEHKQEGIRNPEDKPMLFARWPETLIGHDAPLLIPRVSKMLDFEAELLVVIGRDTGRYVPAEHALRTVFGYSCMNEASVRDWQRHSSQVTAGKNFVGTGAVGPWIVTADEIPDPQSLDLEFRLNGHVMQHANTRDMIWPIAETIEYITNWIPLHPGDMIATGTPAGVGSRRNPPVFMQPGDIAEVSISGIGTLRNVVAPEPEFASALS